MNFRQLADELDHRFPKWAALMATTVVCAILGAVGLYPRLMAVLAPVPILAAMVMLYQVTKGSRERALQRCETSNREKRALGDEVDRHIETIDQQQSQLARFREVVEEFYKIEGTIEYGMEELSESAHLVSGEIEKSHAQSETIFALAEKAKNDLHATSDGLANAVQNLSGTSDAASKLNDAIETIAKTTSQNHKSIERVVQIGSSFIDKVQAERDRSKHIGSVIGMIEKIAAQTDLLALNATIEAASAGKAGRGFSIVANEIKALSRQTRQSAQQIRDDIEKMVNANREVADAVTKLAKTMNEMKSLADESRETVTQQSTTTNSIVQMLNTSAQQLDASLPKIDRLRSSMNDVDNQIAQLTKAIASVENNNDRNVATIELINEYLESVQDVKARLDQNA